MGLILSSIAILALSGLPGCFFSAKTATGQRITALCMLAGSALGLLSLVLTPEVWLRLPWFLPWGQFAVAIDPLSSLFLGLVFLIPLLGSMYGLGYWKQSEHPENGQKLGLFYGIFVAAMALVTLARDGVLFLIAWEIMAMAAYFAATVEEDNPEVRRAGWVYLVATHTGTLCLFAMFALWQQTTGSFALEMAPLLPSATAGTIFVLALVGFGFKAGLMPLHLWLPGAHANAPSHVSAVMSGVMLKMGIYGLVRMTALLPAVAIWWGGTLLAAGALTGVAGIAFAMGQSDVKRLLAYSSIENIGVIAMGIGLALLGRGVGRWDFIMLGLGAALLHVWNHGLFKSLLFFNAGALIHAARTRNIDQLGGLAGQMPRATVLFLVGTVAICALPPLNGFVSEWLLYTGLFHTLDLAGGPGLAAAAAAALAATGAIAIACFVKLFGTVFLGLPRTAEQRQAHDPSFCMFGPMAVLAAGCLGIGLFPKLVMPVIEKAVKSWAVPPSATWSLTQAMPWAWITWLGLALVVLAGGLFAVLKKPGPAAASAQQGTWDCGYARPVARMQYTGSSFGQSLVGLFAFMLWPREHGRKIRGIFPEKNQFKQLLPDVVLDGLVLPLFRVAGRHLPRIRVLQQGQIYLYLFYVLVATIVLLVFGGKGFQV